MKVLISMDDISYSLMTYFVEKYLTKDDLLVCDVGSLNINGTFKPLFKNHNYIGLDIIEGSNVDIVSRDLYKYPFEDGKFDVVISGSTIEHVEDIFEWIREIARITKNGGYVCIIGPSILRIQHQHPVDCWRIYPDGMRYLLGKIANMEVLEARRSERGNRETILCIGIGRK